VVTKYAGLHKLLLDFWSSDNLFILITDTLLYTVLLNPILLIVLLIHYTEFALIPGTVDLCIF